MTAPSPAVQERAGSAAAQFLDSLTRTTAVIATSAADRDRQRHYPTAEYDTLRDIGFWRLTIPAEYGGLGLDRQALVSAVIELAAADGSLGQLPQNHFSNLERLRLTGSPTQQRRIFSRVAAGAVLGNASAEPRERPPGEATTRILAGTDGYRLTGRKVYSTGALLSDIIAVQARDDAGAQVVALIDRNAPGVSVIDDWSGFGQRTTASGSVTFDGAAVDADDILAPGPDPRPRYRIGAQSQLLHCAIDTGIAEGALRAATDLAGSVHGGRGSNATEFADDALGVARLGELWIAVQTARAVVSQSAKHLDELTDSSALPEVLEAFYGIAAAKAVSTDAALTVTSALIDIGGASSTHTDLDLDRYWRDARTHTVHDAVRWKPYAIGRRLISGDVADPWSFAHPFTPFDHLDHSSSTATFDTRGTEQ